VPENRHSVQRSRRQQRACWSGVWPKCGLPAEIKRARLKDAIDRGYEDVATGKVIRLESDDQIDAFLADL
jgi:hypothetical protein